MVIARVKTDLAPLRNDFTAAKIGLASVRGLFSNRINYDDLEQTILFISNPETAFVNKDTIF